MRPSHNEQFRELLWCMRPRNYRRREARPQRIAAMSKRGQRS